MEELFLDLHKVELYGWEKYKSKNLVYSLLEGIEQGDNFPPVSVVSARDFYYLDQLIFDRRFSQGKVLDGGHTRAYAHYILKKPLRCSITRVSENIFPPNRYFPIRDIIIADKCGKNGCFIDLNKQALQKMACDSGYRK